VTALRITIGAQQPAERTILIRRTETARGGHRPITAIFAAALIVFIQLVAASHHHNLPSSRHTAQTQISADSELCPVCLIAFHAPAVSSPAPAQYSPEVAIHYVLASNSAEISEVAFESHFGRAPPASL
jgi:hypothetical protein